MAPEQAQRGAKVRPATDVWAIGLIAFYIVTGRYYWHNANASHDEFNLPSLLVEVLTAPIEAASQRARALGAPDALPAGFDAWFGRCVDRASDARFRNANEAFEELRRALMTVPATQTLGSATLQSLPPLRIDNARGEPYTAGGVATPPPLSPSSRRALWLAAAAGVAVCLGTIAIGLSSIGDATSADPAPLAPQTPQPTTQAQTSQAPTLTPPASAAPTVAPSAVVPAPADRASNAPVPSGGFGRPSTFAVHAPRGAYAPVRTTRAVTVSGGGDRRGLCRVRRQSRRGDSRTMDWITRRRASERSSSGGTEAPPQRLDRRGDRRQQPPVRGVEGHAGDGGAAPGAGLARGGAVARGCAGRARGGVDVGIECWVVGIGRWSVGIGCWVVGIRALHRAL